MNRSCLIAIWVQFFCLLLLRATDSNESAQLLGPVSKIPCDILLLSGKDNHFAWFAHQNDIQRELIRVDLTTGKTATLDLSALGGSDHPTLLSAIPGKNTLLAFTGSPPRFVEIDPEKMTYSVISAVVGGRTPVWKIDNGTSDQQGNMFVGMFPNSRLVSFNPTTGQYHDYGSIDPDPRQQYVRAEIVTADGKIVYCPTGLFKSEIWALDLQSGSKQQILPPEMILPGTKIIIWRSADGQVYGTLNDYSNSGKPSASFACLKDHIEIRPTIPPSVPLPTFGGNRVLTMETDGKIKGKTSTGGAISWPTDFPGVGGMIFSLPAVFQHMLLGSTFIPGELFGVDLTTNKITDFGRKTTGHIEIYDILPYKKGLVLGSYTGGWIDYLDSPSSERKPLAHLALKPWEQERPVQLALGADGAVYVASVPIKAQLGGALTRVDVEKDTFDVHRNLIPQQSILSVIPVPHSPLLFCTSGITGGTSAVPSEKEAWIFLWDTTTQKMIFKAQPLAGATNYVRAMPLPDGNIFCLASDGRFVFWNPIDRKVTRAGKLADRFFSFPYINPVLAGAGHKIVIYGATQVFSIDPTTGVARGIFQIPNKSLGFYTTTDGILYFGISATLYRKDLREATKP